MCVDIVLFFLLSGVKWGYFFLNGRSKGNKSFITKSLLSHASLLLLWEICLLYIYSLSACMGNRWNSTVSISHVNTIDKEGKGNVYNKHQPHTVKNFLVQHGGTLLH